MARVYLKKPRESDLHEYLAAVAESVALHRPWVFPDGTEEGFRAYLRRIEDPRQEGFFVCRESDDRMVGLVSLSEIVRGAMRSAYVGYWGVANRCGNGLMTEGVSLVFDHAFSRMQLHRLEVNIQPKNRRSIALAKRLGLRKEGFSPRYLYIDGDWRDHERWAITSEEWKIR